MCYTCYELYGKPKIINDKTKHSAKLISEIYDFNSVGGNCHIVIDDFNVESESIEWCLSEGLSMNIHKHNKKQLMIEHKFLKTFLTLTEDERVSALAIFEGWIQ